MCFCDVNFAVFNSFCYNIFVMIVMTFVINVSLFRLPVCGEELY